MTWPTRKQKLPRQPDAECELLYPDLLSHMHGFFWGGVIVLCLTLLSIAVIMSTTKSNMGRKGFDWGYRLHAIHHQGKPGQELRAGTWRWDLKQKPLGSVAYWSVCSSWPVQLVFFIQPGPPVVGMIPPTVDWAFPHLSSIKKMSQCDGDIFSADVPSSQVTLMCVKLMETTTKQDVLRANSFT